MYTGVVLENWCEKKTGSRQFQLRMMVPSFFGAAKKKLAFRKKEMLSC